MARLEDQQRRIELQEATIRQMGDQSVVIAQ
jgi:hypothetical protein